MLLGLGPGGGSSSVNWLLFLWSFWVDHTPSLLDSVQPDLSGIVVSFTIFRAVPIWFIPFSVKDLIQVSGEGRPGRGGDGSLWEPWSFLPSEGRREDGVEGREPPELRSPWVLRSASDVRESLGRHFGLVSLGEVVKNVWVSDVKVVGYYWR